jgi:folylpolyglutamate synthase
MHWWTAELPTTYRSAAVVPTLSMTLEWLRNYAKSSPRVRLQVLVTGSLYLVGDVLRLLGKVPK